MAKTFTSTAGSLVDPAAVSQFLERIDLLLRPLPNVTWSTEKKTVTILSDVHTHQDIQDSLADTVLRLNNVTPIDAYFIESMLVPSLASREAELSAGIDALGGHETGNKPSLVDCATIVAERAPEIMRCGMESNYELCRGTALVLRAHAALDQFAETLLAAFQGGRSTVRIVSPERASPALQTYENILDNLHRSFPEMPDFSIRALCDNTAEGLYLPLKKLGSLKHLQQSLGEWASVSALGDGRNQALAIGIDETMRREGTQHGLALMGAMHTVTWIADCEVQTIPVQYYLNRMGYNVIVADLPAVRRHVINNLDCLLRHQLKDSQFTDNTGRPQINSPFSQLSIGARK